MKKEQEITLQIMTKSIKQGAIGASFPCILGFIISLISSSAGFKENLKMALLSYLMLSLFIGLIISLVKVIIKGNQIAEPFTPKPTPQLKQQPEDDDDFDLPGFGVIVWESAEGLPINFNYRNAAGVYTERSVILHKIYKDGKTRFYFQGTCLLRHASRTFLSTNIEDIYDNNGELIELPDFVNALTGYDAFGTSDVRAVKTSCKKKTKSKP